ncbi:RNA uclease 4 [Phytophthora palmivora]|uniref:RNA uclease 4 n=1 Tax=Phytophthora palmivora TaxID=4796 RepID=A0A2P4YGP8_9STRA|nr:RNA uclease 4 [Phytophthora palmivora]
MGGKRKRNEGSTSVQAGDNKSDHKVHHSKKKHKLSTSKKVSGSATHKPQEKAPKSAKPATLANSNWLALKSKIQQKNQELIKASNDVDKQNMCMFGVSCYLA